MYSKFLHWSNLFASKGYESLLVQVHPHIGTFSSAEQGATHGKGSVDIETMRKHLAALEGDLLSSFRNSTSTPFPPLLLSHLWSTLLAETYVSSHPLSGLVLCSPPSLSELGRLIRSKPHKSLSKEDVASMAVPAASSPSSPIQDLFNYEPGFPIAITLPPLTAAASSMKEQHRLIRDFGEDGDNNVEAWLDKSVEEQNWERVMDWMDENRL
ncbi:BQ2448_5009 [Microbotryum intermedium]|uniref:BQ2448_5009 protein n=1 Tax=Microbotryum intermedium TaxID=269621 RepID=A0A238F8A3_9BASI|nr:BQ2448_5009 [Microbotryum intermedium]